MVGLFYTFLFVFLLLCIVLCGLILVQESKSMGLGSSFGVDSGDSVFGVATPDVLKKITAWLAVAFCVSCLILSSATHYLGKKYHPSSVVSEVIEEDEASTLEASEENN